MQNIHNVNRINEIKKNYDNEKVEVLYTVANQGVVFISHDS